MSVLLIAGIHFPSHGSKIRIPTSCDMSLGAMDGVDLPCHILWPIRTEDHSFWCLDAWKGDWVQLDKCSFIAPVGIEHFFVFLLAILQRTLISTSRREANSRSPQDVYQLNDGQSQSAWMLERKVDPVMIVDGRGYLTTPLLIQMAPSWRPRRWPLTRTGI